MQNHRSGVHTLTLIPLALAWAAGCAVPASGDIEDSFHGGKGEEQASAAEEGKAGSNVLPVLTSGATQRITLGDDGTSVLGSTLAFVAIAPEDVPSSVTISAEAIERPFLAGLSAEGQSQASAPRMFVVEADTLAVLASSADDVLGPNATMKVRWLTPGRHGLRVSGFAGDVVDITVPEQLNPSQPDKGQLQVSSKGASIGQHTYQFYAQARSTIVLSAHIEDETYESADAPVIVLYRGPSRSKAPRIWSTLSGNPNDPPRQGLDSELTVLIPEDGPYLVSIQHEGASYATTTLTIE